MLLNSLEPKVSTEVLIQVITLCHHPSLFNQIDLWLKTENCILCCWRVVEAWVKFLFYFVNVAPKQGASKASLLRWWEIVGICWQTCYWLLVGCHGLLWNNVILQRIVEVRSYKANSFQNLSIFPSGSEQVFQSQCYCYLKKGVCSLHYLQSIIAIIVYCNNSLFSFDVKPRIFSTFLSILLYDSLLVSRQWKRKLNRKVFAILHI